jgi:pimeloyl-ACP methyl ester carboxylesterase
MPYAVRLVVAAAVLAAVTACASDDDASTPTPVAGPETADRSSSTTSGPAIGSSTAPSTSAVPSSAFTTAACPGVPSDPARVTCGYLDVPEHHDDPAGPTVRMAVAIVAPASTVARADPVLYLPGGPGYGATGLVEQFLSAPWVTDRAMVLVDPRGAGASQPSLACPELDAATLVGLGALAGDPAGVERQAVARRACRARLVAAGVDVAAYDYTEIAADLADLRVALGYRDWNVYGISNGGRLALELVRRHPDGVRSLLLDAALPPQGNLPGELWVHADRAFDALFAGCAADTACAGAYPGLDATFAALLEQLHRRPVTVEVQGDSGPLPVVLDDVLLADALRGAMYDSTLIPLIPLVLTGLAQGEGAEVVAQTIVDAIVADQASFSAGMALSVNCREEVAFLSPDTFERLAAQAPVLAGAILGSAPFAGCADWDAGAADASVEAPVVSEVPALVLVGQYDPVHPRASSEAIVDGLSHATLVEIPGLGHGTVGVDPCPTSLVRLFLDEPGAPVDTGCVAGMGGPVWALP